MELFFSRRNRSPLILAVIFITFFHIVLSRHRIRHYKDRFKRQQGAHLYLPDTYVTEGGEGPEEGPWLDWSEPSPCSRTCGGGVSTQYRQCQQGYSCQGPDRRHFSCNTQDCPDTGDFRAQQCSEYDEVPFENIKYQWVPYTKGPNPCELNCMPRGQRFYYRHAPQVVDGTRCNDESFDVCVNGQCQPVGCDMMLGSDLREDECRVCGGDGSTCNTISNTLELNDLQVGYNDILLIPGGATNIVVEEVQPSNNYFAVRNTSGHYYLNGNWRIDLPRTIDFAGSKFHYERYPQGFAAPDKIYTLGPIDEPLFIVLLYQDTAVPVQYKYSLPTNVQPGSESETYAWTFDEFTPCTATCGGGIQHRNVSCAGRKTLEPVDETLCDAARKPETSRKCNEVACKAHWVPHPWGNCSTPCGEEGGIQTREISCQQIVSNGYPSLVDDSECQGPKPPQQQKCNQGKTCAKWHIGPWKPCDHLCGDGQQIRTVQCFIKDEKNKIQILEDQQCEAIEPKPAEQQKCFVRPCEGVDWITSEWSGCDSVCGLTNETRKIFCATANGQIYSDELCDQSEKPETVRKCDGANNASCNFLWYASQWSECSAKCGKGIQTRTLFCGLATAKGAVEKVENEKCDQNKTFETLRNCTGVEECDGEWFSGPLGECSKPCGGGTRSRKVVCVKGNQVVDVSHCDAESIIYSAEDCNQQPCTEDSILPVDKEETVPVEEEPEKTTTAQSTQEASIVTDKETDETLSDISLSDISELTKSFEITTEADTKKSTDQASEEDDDDDYELVLSDSCDDGEWVEVAGVLKEEETESTDLIETTDFFDYMYSDGSTLVETPFTGSGDGESSSVTERSKPTSSSSDFTEEEGSGDITSVVTDVSYISSSEGVSGSTVSKSISIGDSDATTEGVSATAESTDISSTNQSSISEFSETESIGTSESTISTEIPVSSGTSGETVETTEVFKTSEISESSETPEISETSVSSDKTETTEISETSVSSDRTETTESSKVYDTSETTNTIETDSTNTETSTETTITSSTSTTDSDTEPSTESISTDSSVTTETISTETTETTNTAESSETTESSDTTETTESSDTTETTESSDTTETTESSDTTETTESSDTTETTESSDTTETTESSDTTETTESSDTTESKYTTENTESTTEVSITTSGSTKEGDVIKEEPGADIPTPPSRDIVDDSEETTSESALSSEGTTEVTDISRSTESSATEATTGFTESTPSDASTTEVSGSTNVSDLTEVSGTTEVPTGSREVSGTTTEISSSLETLVTELSGSTETLETGTTESTTEFSGSTDIFSSTTETSEETTWPTTHITDIFKKKQKMCKRKKILQCQKTKYGCCWDNIHEAKGPFDKGCPTPKTCKESTYGCCSDGVSAALGPKNRGCPPSQCNETLFGCCWDKKTPAEGNDNEGCPTPPPACLESKWGCCDDNSTAAKGPKQKGCKPEEEEKTIKPPTSTDECSKTDYGCCPDGSPAKGPQYQGCNIPCANSTYGCCPDKETPAHGDRGEGCCLSGPFGCCPDDITQARGANGDGCECQYSPYGCCPDNLTPAKGYNNEGCGCKYTEHGCCPDDFTAASGPDYEGCPCHTFQFGCCSDGVSVAKGPHQQGCDCRTSEHGCCGDGKTPAQGLNKEGCGCEVSRYGCCLDGVSEAKGDNFEGCEEVPVDQQNACSLPKERGPCRNYTVKWFFDMSYGGCSRFWYGGCDGNENRFRSKEECEGVCVTPQGTDRCNLPKVQGSCEGYFLQWYFDKESKHCQQFVYGGCLGNNNRFETREECTELCASDDSVDPCEQVQDEGPCHGQYRRYFFDKESGQCREFIYGGCKGNNNNFLTVESCKQRCATPGKKRDYCTIPKAEGNCTAREAKWYYGAQEQRCLPFYYSGCNSNRNSFENKNACQNDCPTEVAKDTCHLPADIGECGNYMNRWYWDTKDKRCRQFYWGGCGGNDNNFQTEQECEQSCSSSKPEQPQVQEPVRPMPDERLQTQPPLPTAQVPSPTSRAPTLEEICSLVPDPGPCTEFALHYYYDGVDGVCKNFTYGGCGGNYNNFENEDICLQYCGSTRALPPVQEPAPVVTEAPSVQVPPVFDTQCYEEPDSGNCTENYPAFYFDRSIGQCKPFNFTGCGGNRNRFYSEEDCERQCGSYRGQDICNLEKNPGPCKGYFVKYYFDRAVGRCEQFAYGGCQGNGNRFSSMQECEHYCGRQEEPRPNITSAEVCQLSADQGTCPEANHKRWYFDNTQGECKAFIYTGCGGNLNNFKTFQSCLEYCKDFLPYTEPPVQGPDVFAPHECQVKFDECNTLRCPYGIEAYVDENDCNGCRCRDPCKDIECPDETQCGIDLNRNKTFPQDADFVAICREKNKAGQCPYPQRNDSSCDNECQNDADCALHLKCCTTNCGTICLEPEKPSELVTVLQTSEPGYTQAPPVIYYAPRIDVETYEPEVSALLGDQATLNCAVTGNPNPKITWSKDNIIIDGTQPRYRIRLDQTLQIITLHKTDSGVYLCTAENNIGNPIQNQIKLEVLDSPVDRPVTILNGADPELLVNNIVTSFNSPASLNCFALGWPLPAVTWWKEDELIPLKNREFEVTKDYSLIIHSVQLHNLGVYTCQAYNGKGKAASWSVTVRAKGPYYSSNPSDIKYLQYVVNPSEPSTTNTGAPIILASSPRPNLPVYPPVQRPTPQPYIPPVYSTETNPDIIDPNEIVPEIPDAAGHRPPPLEPVYIVPVRANITTNDRRYPTGSDVEIRCDVYGYPSPQVKWYKDGVSINFNDRITESDIHTLTIKAAEKSDSGRYQCEAINPYSKASSTLDILIEGMYIHPSCTDNQFFANCKLIVKGKYCNHKYYAKFCCRSCTEAGELPVDGPHLGLSNKQNALDTNAI